MSMSFICAMDVGWDFPYRPTATVSTNQRSRFRRGQLMVVRQEIKSPRTLCLKSHKPPTGAPPADGLHVDVAQGAISLTNKGGTQIVDAGQFAYVRDASTPPVIQPPSQGIQVTMPAHISRNTSSGRTVGTKRDDMECAVQ
jgi:hypothetical protein